MDTNLNFVLHLSILNLLYCIWVQGPDPGLGSRVLVLGPGSHLMVMPILTHEKNLTYEKIFTPFVIKTIQDKLYRIYFSLEKK